MMEHHDHLSDARLLSATATGDGLAFEAFYRRHLPLVVAFLLRRTNDREVAADLAGEVFAAALLQAARFEPRGSDDAIPWLLGIARNQVRLLWRRGRIEQCARQRVGLEREAFDDADLARVDDLAAAGEPALALLSALPDGEQRAVRDYAIAGRSYAEIASADGCSQAAARQRVSRGLARLRQQLTGG